MNNNFLVMIRHRFSQVMQSNENHLWMHHKKIAQLLMHYNMFTSATTTRSDVNSFQH